MKNKDSFGLTNEIWVSEDKKILYKKSFSYTDFFLDRKNEVNVYEQLKLINEDWYIIPYYWKFEKNFYTETHFYQNTKTLNPMKLTSTEIDEIKILIDKVHSLNLDKIKFFDPIILLTKIESKFGEIEELKIFRSEIEAIINKIWNKKTKFVFSHNDLVKGNFIKIVNKWKIIDFEYASYNHYLFDYASFMSESLPENKWENFVKRINLTKEELHQLTDIINYQNYLWANWAMYMFKSTAKEIYEQIYFDKLSMLKRKNTLFSFLK